MKYILLCVAAAAVCFGLGAAPTLFIKKKSARTLSRGKSIGMSAAFGVAVLVLVSAGYLSIYYRADDAAVACAAGISPVRVQQIDGGYYFDGPGADTALVFYPGAKVDTLAYAPLMTELAGRGIDCFLAEVPFHMAMFGSDRAGQFIGNYDYDTWVTAGHSMGGLIAADYAAKHPDQVSAVVLLGAYPTSKIPDGIRLCSVYGNNDLCLEREVYEKARALWPEDSTETCIDGGNHAQFGNYGAQKGDGIPTISAEEQQRMTAEIICESVLRN